MTLDGLKAFVYDLNGGIIDIFGRTRFSDKKTGNIDALVKSIEMAKEKVPYTRFSVWPGLK